MKQQTIVALIAFSLCACSRTHFVSVQRQNYEAILRDPDMRWIGDAPRGETFEELKTTHDRFTLPCAINAYEDDYIEVINGKAVAVWRPKQ